MIKFIDLFAGIGGFHLGLTKANDEFKCVYSNEINKFPRRIYEKHFGEIDGRDIRHVVASELPDFDLLVGGFPCQAFSIAGLRRGFRDTRATLFYDVARIAKEKQPRLILLENVKGLLSHKKGDTFATILSTLDELGYDAQWQVLNSKNFGVPQNRERVFIIGHLRGTSRPKVFPIKNGSGSALRELTTKAKLQDRVYSSDGISPAIVTGSGGRHEPKIGVVVQNGVVKYKDIANTLDANYFKGLDNHQQRTGVLYNDFRIRKLTPIECERLQGFPDGWTEGLSNTQRYKALGNAVTVPVVEAIGKKLCQN